VEKRRRVKVGIRVGKREKCQGWGKGEGLRVEKG